MLLPHTSNQPTDHFPSDPRTPRHPQTPFHSYIQILALPTLLLLCSSLKTTKLSSLLMLRRPRPPSSTEFPVTMSCSLDMAARTQNGQERGNSSSHPTSIRVPCQFLDLSLDRVSASGWNRWCFCVKMINDNSTPDWELSYIINPIKPLLLFCSNSLL